MKWNFNEIVLFFEMMRYTTTNRANGEHLFYSRVHLGQSIFYVALTSTEMDFNVLARYFFDCIQLFMSIIFSKRDFRFEKLIIDNYINDLFHSLCVCCQSIS